MALVFPTGIDQGIRKTRRGESRSGGGGGRRPVNHGRRIEMIRLKSILGIVGLLLPAAVSFGQDAAGTAELTIDAGKPGEVISKHIYGHFAEHLGRCVYDGIWVGKDSPVENIGGYRKDIVDALQAIKIPNLRWPGGCFADQYHWKEGVGPAPDRPELVNVHWGQVTEDNSFGTHEFLDYCELIGAEPYLAGNVGSGTVEEMFDWVEYTNRDEGGDMAAWRKKNGRDKPWGVRFWGIGNENWGCGGNMTPEYYANEFKRYSTFVRRYGENRPYRVACGASDFNYEWTEVLMREARGQMDGISVHYYTFTGSWREKGSATAFDEGDYMALLKRVARMDELLAGHVAVMDKYDERNRVGLVVDEWGNWWDAEPGRDDSLLYQQNTVRDAVTAGITMNILNSWARRVKVANIAQLVNVLQSLFLTEGEKMILTPTYHVFDLYQIHQDARLLPVELKTPDYAFGNESFPALSVSSSKSESGRINLTLVHADTKGPLEVACKIDGASPTSVAGRIVAGDSIREHNTFDRPDNVKTEPFDGARIDGDTLRITLPPLSVVALTLD
jgi:alpha-N-arabinofuranosidase